MSSADRIEEHGSKSVATAQAIEEAAGQTPGSAASSPLLSSLQQALPLPSGATWDDVASCLRSLRAGLFGHRPRGRGKRLT
jgi:hypothetical protein